MCSMIYTRDTFKTDDLYQAHTKTAESAKCFHFARTVNNLDNNAIAKSGVTVHLLDLGVNLLQFQ